MKIGRMVWAGSLFGLLAISGFAAEAFDAVITPSVEKRIDTLIGQMTLDEKVSMLTGATYWDTKSIGRLGIPSLRVMDGPHGVRTGKATCFPTGVSMGACWNDELMRRVGAAMARECRAKGNDVLLGPCINIHRAPLGGRNFESMSEDPFLAGRIAVAYVRGVQSQRVGTSVKHFACNNQEWERGSISVEIDERALREIYLPAFRMAVQEASPCTLMAAYNKIRGSHCSENKYLLTDILKKEWSFKGFVVSDWGGTHSTVPAVANGLDLEMPGPGPFLGMPLLDPVRKGELAQSGIDESVRRILRVLFFVGAFDNERAKLPQALDTFEHRELARELAAEAIVLLKNDRGVLPIGRENAKSIAVIGPSAAVARTGGGGSSEVEPFYSVSPLQGLQKRCGDAIRVRYARGCLLPAEIEAIGSKVLLPEGGVPGQHGLKGEYFNNQDFSGDPVLTRIDEQIDFEWGGGAPAPGIGDDNFSVRWTGKLVPLSTFKYRIGMTSDDGIRLYIDDKLLVDHWKDHGPATQTAEIDLEAGKEYRLRIEYHEASGGAMVRLGWAGNEDYIGQAAQLAADCDVAVVCAGLSVAFEGEGNDRNTLDMPGPQKELIEAVAKANSNTVVVLFNGTPVPMPWLSQVAAVVEAWYPGQEGGNAIAAVLLGDTNPSGKLPFTFPKKLSDSPAQANYPGSNGVVRYAEGLYVGYRYYDTKNVEPLFPFGYGLSYTRFKYDHLKVNGSLSAAQPKVTVTLDVENTGAYAGKEVVQLYVHDVESSLDRPAREMKGFNKVALAPGEKTNVTFTLDKDTFAFYHPDRKEWVVEPGEFEILIGSSSRDLRLKQTLKLE